MATEYHRLCLLVLTRIFLHSMRRASQSLLLSSKVTARLISSGSETDKKLENDFSHNSEPQNSHLIRVKLNICRDHMACRVQSNQKITSSQLILEAWAVGSLTLSWYICYLILFCCRTHSVSHIQ